MKLDLLSVRHYKEQLDISVGVGRMTEEEAERLHQKYILLDKEVQQAISNRKSYEWHKVGHSKDGSDIIQIGPQHYLCRGEVTMSPTTID